ncbi:hypothetical protein N4G69_49415 [Streptomyces mirabilis]|uniref:hypothetical protein n=1 Tax=Streptomyces mirabilis TaxID=68239 RepID=UPI0021C1D05E|nr:hypothetical protein [Streptomyces mirabilis]MCT9113449.1 hypothetical protein [Streptomyces mirabilis]
MSIKDDVRRWWASPAARALVFVLLAVLVFYGLVLFAQLNSRDDAFVDHGFRLWAAMATFSFTVWIALLGRGIAAIRAFPTSWQRGRRWWLASLATYAVLMLAATTLIRGVTRGNSFEVPIRHFPALISVLTAAGAAAAAPWVLSVWLAQERAQKLAEQGTSQDGAADFPAIAVTDVVAVWRVIERSGLALSLIVSTSTFNTGALRLALIGSDAIEPDDFPPVFVLGYGAFFAAVLVAILLPLVLTWRTRAFALVEQELPAPDPGLLSEDLLAARARMEAQLHVDVRFLRNPMAILSVLSPFATALITTLVPNGG